MKDDSAQCVSIPWQCFPKDWYLETLSTVSNDLKTSPTCDKGSTKLIYRCLKIYKTDLKVEKIYKPHLHVPNNLQTASTGVPQSTNIIYRCHQSTNLIYKWKRSKNLKLFTVTLLWYIWSRVLYTACPVSSNPLSDNLSPKLFTSM